jgi:acyl-CoA thioester hydrolase/thioesterase-3
MYSTFKTEITIRPDDIDMNNHVHYSKYLDYLLAARYEQMHRDYKMSMEEFSELGYSWVASSVTINFKRSLELNDTAIVKTQVNSYSGANVKINFWILKKENEKIAAEGTVDYTMISVVSGRPVRITEDIIKKYSI